MLSQGNQTMVWADKESRLKLCHIVHHRARYTFSHNVRYNLACLQLPFYLPRLSCLCVTFFTIFPEKVEIGGIIRVVGRRWGIENPRWVWHVCFLSSDSTGPRSLAL